ncbi:MAG: histidinol dehydrogenase [Clostridia bacterium]|nr:histidinol dehydrogenase [Clostridia bacterium]
MKIYDLNTISIDEILKREDNPLAGSITDTVSQIISDVRQRGETALKELCSRFDAWNGIGLEVTRDEIRQAYKCLNPRFVATLEKAAENIRTFHRQQIRPSFVITGEDGIVMGQKVMPIAKVGVYVPGGTAALSSTVLMDVIPAKLAGCPEIVVTTPARGGRVDPAILAAADIAGADRIFKVGGAQAIAALAYGADPIPGVDKIVGPGNAYVTEAKRQVFGRVAIDMIAGPSEILVVADKDSDPEHLAADLLSQAEHDKMASAVLVTDCADLAAQVSEAVERQLAVLPRREIAEASIKNNGKIIVAKDIDTVIDIANRIAPEHLELCVSDPFKYLDRIHNAGSIFMGRYCPEALGDYMAGPNHTLPTSGTARFSSPLSVDDFVKRSQFTYYTREALEKVSGSIALFARQEGLEGHARSALIRTRTED